MIARSTTGSEWKAGISWRPHGVRQTHPASSDLVGFSRGSLLLSADRLGEQPCKSAYSVEDDRSPSPGIGGHVGPEYAARATVEAQHVRRAFGQVRQALPFCARYCQPVRLQLGLHGRPRCANRETRAAINPLRNAYGNSHSPFHIDQPGLAPGRSGISLKVDTAAFDATVFTRPTCPL